MEANKQLIEKFYTAFAASDAETMASCYHEQITFEDPAFGVLQGKRASYMWEMLLSGSKSGKSEPIKIEFSDVNATESEGSVKWVATYKFSSTKRLVVNRVQANFMFKDGLIIKHNDVFDFWKWSSQALGLSGHLFGWCNCFKNKVRGQALGRLNGYIEKINKPDETVNIVN
jgi:hypothetical protein